MDDPATALADESRVNFIFAPDPSVAGGGAELRTEELFRRVASLRRSRLITVGTSDAGRPSAAARARAAARGVPPRLSQLTTPRSHDAALDDVGPDELFIACTTFSLPRIPEEWWSRTILDAHNLEWRIVRQMARSHPSRLRRVAYRSTIGWTRWYERRAVRRLAGAWAVSEDEAAWMRACGARRVWVVPSGVTLPEPSPLPANPTLLFVGSMNSLFNREAVEWFIAKCWPRVLAARPDARFVVAGRGSEQVQGPSVEGLGPVPDLDPVYACARCCIAPLLQGAGTRMKVPEAMAHGRPVVSTTMGADGIELGPGCGVVIVDTPVAFTAECLRILDDDVLAADLAAAGRALAEERFSWDRSAATALESLGELTNG